MKIGEFSNTNKVSKDAIRHYMDLGLIIPEKIGGQYDFDQECQRSLDEIIYLKNLGFTLSEVKTIFLFKSLGKLSSYQKDEYYKDLFLNKLDHTLNQIELLGKVARSLREEVEDLSSYELKKNYRLGLDIGTLSIFTCIACGEKLIVEDGDIRGNQIFDASLKCISCEEKYRIEDGIIIVDNQKPRTDEEFKYKYISNYIRETHPSYLDNVYKSIEWIKRKVDYKSLSNKIILELGSGTGFMLRSSYRDLPDDSIYIAVDHDIKRHKFLKSMLESADTKKNIVFICTDFTRIPIKNKSVDVLLDFSGTSNYSFDNEGFLLDLVDSYIKDDAYLMATYILFNNFGFDSLIDEKFRKNFKLEHIKDKIKDLGYKKYHDHVSDFIERGGSHESYFVSGEKVYTYLYYGKR